MTCLFDNYQRRISYLRISVTDHCDLRCIYCTAHLVSRLNHDDILRYEEIERIVRVSVGLGGDSIRLTGGEPLKRPHLENLVSLLRNIDGVKDISMTSNGTMLEKKALALFAAGLDRVNISLDSLREDRFRYMTGRGDLKQVLRGIEAARRIGMNPVKINTVMLAGVNDDELLDFARKTISDGWHVRFIEYMPFACDGSKGDRFQENQTVRNQPITDIIAQNLGELNPVRPSRGCGHAKCFHLPEADGSIGLIGAVTECFCDAVIECGLRLMAGCAPACLTTKRLR
jgi:cyclic pyranopterin phosphate synthase